MMVLGGGKLIFIGTAFFRNEAVLHDHKPKVLILCFFVIIGKNLFTHGTIGLRLGRGHGRQCQPVLQGEF